MAAGPIEIAGVLEALSGSSQPLCAALARAVAGAKQPWSGGMLEAVLRLGAQVSSGSSVPEERFLASISPDAREEVSRLVRTIGTPEAFGLLDQDPELLFAGPALFQHGVRQLRPLRFIEGMALHRSTLARIRRIILPRKGLRIVTRRSTFHVLRLERIRWDPRLIVYVDRYADAAVRSLVARAVLVKTRVQVWADLSLSGVLFARSIAVIAKHAFGAPQMSRQHLDWAPQRIALTEGERNAIDENLGAEPDAPLAATLRAIRQHGGWLPTP